MAGDIALAVGQVNRGSEAVKLHEVALQRERHFLVALVHVDVFHNPVGISGKALDQCHSATVLVRHVVIQGVVVA